MSQIGQQQNTTISILGCGWLGLPLAMSFNTDKWEVHGSTTTAGKTTILEQKGIIPHVFDIKNVDKVSFSTFLCAKLLVVNIPSKDIAAFERILPWIAESTIEKVVFISSTSVYGRGNRGKVWEESPVDNTNPLTQIEQLFIQCSDFDTTILRMGGLIGEGRHPGRFFVSKPVPNPEGVVNMITLQDCITTIRAVVQHSKWGQIYNVCSHEHPNRREFYTQAMMAYNGQIPVFKEEDKVIYKEVVVDKLIKDLRLQFSLMDKDMFKN